MQVIKHTDTNKLAASSSTSIWEYLTHDQDISGAVAKINGRYPETGFAMNEVSKELVYVLEGNGSVIRKDGSVKISKGDVILLQPNELFAWSGTLTLFMATAPTFDPKQHKIIQL